MSVDEEMGGDGSDAVWVREAVESARRVEQDVVPSTFFPTFPPSPPPGTSRQFAMASVKADGGQINLRGTWYLGYAMLLDVNLIKYTCSAPACE
jgi:hypothetical protein